MVRLRSAGAPNLKAVLKKIIKDAVAAGRAAASGSLEGTEDDGVEVSVGEDVCFPPISIFMFPPAAVWAFIPVLD